VVATAYRVSAVAAAEFMAAFYERLFAGDRVAEAVAAGCRQLAQRNARPSPKGGLPLADWVVPLHYAAATCVSPAFAPSAPLACHWTRCSTGCVRAVPATARTRWR
jgi:CHAT domain-containing protein